MLSGAINETYRVHSPLTSLVRRAVTRSIPGSTRKHIYTNTEHDN